MPSYGLLYTIVFVTNPGLGDSGVNWLVTDTTSNPVESKNMNAPGDASRAVVI